MRADLVVIRSWRVLFRLTYRDHVAGSGADSTPEVTSPSFAALQRWAGPCQPRLPIDRPSGQGDLGVRQEEGRAVERRHPRLQEDAQKVHGPVSGARGGGGDVFGGPAKIT